MRNATISKFGGTYRGTYHAPMDGNCLFHCIGRSRTGHREARAIATEHMRSHWMHYKNFVPAAAHETYLYEMQQDGTWGDHLAIHAFSEATGTPVTVMDPEHHVMAEFQPGATRGGGIRLIFNGCHYDAIA